MEVRRIEGTVRACVGGCGLELLGRRRSHCKCEGVRERHSSEKQARTLIFASLGTKRKEEEEINDFFFCRLQTHLRLFAQQCPLLSLLRLLSPSQTPHAFLCVCGRHRHGPGHRRAGANAARLGDGVSARPANALASSSKNVFRKGPAVNKHGHARPLTTHTLASTRIRPGPSSWTTSKTCVFVG